MKVVSTRVSDELYSALVQLGNDKGMNVSQTTASIIQGAIQGKIPLRSLAKQDVCPRCGGTLHLLEGADNKLYFWCHRCDWMAYLGVFTWPKDIEDWRQKIKEA